MLPTVSDRSFAMYLNAIYIDNYLIWTIYLISTPTLIDCFILCIYNVHDRYCSMHSIYIMMFAF